MKPLHQTITHDPGDGRVGDCWRTCIAALLDLDDPTDVPHFVEHGIDAQGERGSLHALWAREWLRDTHGLDIARILPGSADRTYWCIATVRSPRGPWLHSIVMTSDGQHQHDPHPLNEVDWELDDVVQWETLVLPYDPDPADDWHQRHHHPSAETPMEHWVPDLVAAVSTTPRSTA